ncbi:MAG: MerR family transcriptional regulator [Candidatus Dadabacteria bacterium]|nr:MAG: MerR family transcriptional regulator [Candidatus Dadabacteria bacterium]
MATASSKKKDLLRISDLARLTGVSPATIKFYIREGLLPPPTLKTGRNMAYYDRSFVDRIRTIKELQRKRFLPLDVIKAILDRDFSVISQREIDTLLGLEGRFYEEILFAPGREPIPRSRAHEFAGIEREQIDYYVEQGVLSPVVRNGEECFEGDDVTLLETLAAIQNVGITDRLIPKELAIPMYMKAIGDLARNELRMFTRAVTGKVDDARLAEMALAAVKLAEQFILILRRKALLKAIQELREETDEKDTKSVAGR